MTASPARAAALPAVSAHTTLDAPRAWVPADDRAANRGGWGGGHRRHHDGGIDAGDVFAGILILGGIAAIASAASSSKDKKAQGDYRSPEPDYRGPDYRGSDYRSSGSQGWDQAQDRGATRSIDVAVDACANAAAREGEVADIYGVQRTGNGYQVSGKLDNGDEFACSASSDGQIQGLTVDGRDVAARDASFGAEGARYDGTPEYAAPEYAAPAANQGDDRYDTATASDFEDGAGS